jgi:hypothetical protein
MPRSPGERPGGACALPRRACGAVSCAALSDRHTWVSPLRRPHDPARVLTMVAPPTIRWGLPSALRRRAAGLLRPNARTRRRRARHRVQPSHTSPSVRPRSSRMRRRRTGTAGSASAGVNRSGCARSPVMVRASPRALARPAASSSPSCATVCCTTLPPPRYLADQPPVAVDLAGPSAASYGAGTLSSVCAWPRAQVNELSRHYTRRSGPRCAAARTYTPARPATRGRAARTVEVGLGPAAWSPALFEPCPQHPPRRLAPS